MLLMFDVRNLIMRIRWFENPFLKNSFSVFVELEKFTDNWEINNPFLE